MFKNKITPQVFSENDITEIFSHSVTANDAREPIVQEGKIKLLSPVDNTTEEENSGIYSVLVDLGVMGFLTNLLRPGKETSQMIGKQCSKVIEEKAKADPTFFALKRDSRLLADRTSVVSPENINPDSVEEPDNKSKNRCCPFI